MTLVIRFEPGLRPVIKHAQHDQKTHGSWANSWATGDRTTPDDKWLIDNFGDKTTFTRNDPNGLLRFSIPNSLIDDPRYKETIQMSLDTLEKLQAAYPLTTQVDFVAGDKTEGGFLGETLSASVDGVPAPSKIILTEGLLKPNAEKDVLVHTIVHEWGHALDFRTPEESKAQAARFSQAMFEDGSLPMTDYGWYSDREAYAEAFAVKFNGAHKGGVWNQNVPQTDKWEEVFKIFELDSLKKAKGKRVSFLVKDTFDANNPPVLIEDYDPSVQKHQEHDQSTHGNWATGTDGLSVTRDQSSFEQKLVLQNKKGEMLAYVQFQDHRDRVDILFIRSYDSGKGYATRLIEALYSSIPEKKIYWGKTSAPESTHLAQKFSDKYGRTQFMPWAEGAIAGYEWGELYGDTTVKKHQEHDQSTHGSWANGKEALPKAIGYKDSDVVLHSTYDSTREQAVYLEDYTMNAYGPINTYLRTREWLEDNESGLKQSDVQDYTEALDYLISRTEAPRDMLLYRGVTGADKIYNLEVGDTYKDKGFVSTTTQPNQLWSFMSTALGGRFDSRPVQKGVVLQISVPKGSNVLSVNRYFKGVSDRYGPSEGIREEDEYLLPRNLKFRVDSVSFIDVRGTQDKLIKVTVIDNG